MALRGGKGNILYYGLALLVGEGDVIKGEDRRAGCGLQRADRGEVELRGMRTGGGRNQLARGGGLELFFHDLEVVLGTGDGALGGIDNPTHHKDRLLRTGDHLQQHDHIAQGEMPLERAPENYAVNAEEDNGHG